MHRQERSTSSTATPSVCSARHVGPFPTSPGHIWETGYQWETGGSHGQRDVVELGPNRGAAVRTGQHDIASSLAHERLASSPAVLRPGASFAAIAGWSRSFVEVRR